METFTLTLATGTVVFDGTTFTVTATDSTVTTFVTQPETVAAVTDSGITITHSDGTTQDFVPTS